MPRNIESRQDSVADASLGPERAVVVAYSWKLGQHISPSKVAAGKIGVPDAELFAIRLGILTSTHSASY